MFLGEGLLEGMKSGSFSEAGEGKNTVKCSFLLPSQGDGAV